MNKGDLKTYKYVQASVEFFHYCNTFLTFVMFEKELKKIVFSFVHQHRYNLSSLSKKPGVTLLDFPNAYLLSGV